MGRESTLAVQLQANSGNWVEVGHLHHADNRNWFEFTDTYWRLGDRPVLGQVLSQLSARRDELAIVR